MDWYLLAYDVRDERRLKRLHRHLRAKGVALQRSLFLVKGARAEIAALLQEVEEIVHCGEDDVRAFPVHHPSRLWLHGSRLLWSEAPKGEGVAGWLRGLFKGKGDG